MGGAVKALSIRQPWAWAILWAGKDVENRTWPLPARMLGKRVLIHAAKGCTADEYESATVFIRGASGVGGREGHVLPLAELPRGAIVGAATLLRCEHHGCGITSRWFVGPYGFVLGNVRALPTPVPCRGALGFFDVPPDVAEHVLQEAQRA